MSNSHVAALQVWNARSHAALPDVDGVAVGWWLMFETTAKEGSREIVEALQIYVTFLEPAVIHAVTRLLNCDFLRVHLIHIHDIIDANTMHDSDRKVTFFWVDNTEQPRCGYETFWSCVAEVLRLCSHEQTSSGQPRFWRGATNVPPFVRVFYGLLLS
jgi:hypothetical protein